MGDVKKSASFGQKHKKLLNLHVLSYLGVLKDRLSNRLFVQTLNNLAGLMEQFFNLGDLIIFPYKGILSQKKKKKSPQQKVVVVPQLPEGGGVSDFMVLYVSYNNHFLTSPLKCEKSAHCTLLAYSLGSFVF